MSEANHLANESHIAPCFPNDKCIYSSFVSPFPQFNNSTVDATNEYSNLITGSYGQMQEYPIQGSSTKLAQVTGAHNSGDYTAQNIGSWKEGLVSPLRMYGVIYLTYPTVSAIWALLLQMCLGMIKLKLLWLFSQ